LADALGDGVSHGKELVSMFIEHQVIVSEVWPAQVPMKVLGLQIKREHVRKGGVHGAGNVTGCFSRETSRRVHGRPPALLKFICSWRRNCLHRRSSFGTK